MKKKNLSFKIIIFLFFTFFSCNNEENSSSILKNDLIPHNSIETNFSGTVNVLFYLDGDNNLNDTIFENLITLSKGYSKIVDDEGNFLDGFTEINAIVLWDGLDYKAVDYEGNNLYSGTPAEITSTQKYSYYFPQTRLIKLVKTQPDSDDIYQNFNNFSIDISENEEWFSSEMNLADANTLSSFLNFANTKYKSDKTILIIEDHGAGFSGTPEDIDTARAICEDYSSYKYWKEKYQFDVLYNDELRLALEDAGFKNDNKIDLLILDVCDESSIENIYELKDSVKSIIASPGVIPKYGIDYYNFFENLKTDSNIKEFGKKIIEHYAEKYYSPIFNDSGINTIIQNGTGLTFCDLNYASLISEETNTLVDYLLEHEEIRNLLTDSDNSFLQVNYSKRSNYIAYKGSYSYLFDFGYLAYKLHQTAKKQKNTELETITSNLLETISSIIICSWRSSNLSKSSTNKEGTYPSITRNADYFGLTVSTSANRSGNIVIQPYNESEFLFNTDTGWKNLLQILFPEDF